MDDNRKGALLIILAGTCWGVISIFINYLSAAGLGEMQISFLRQFFAALVFCLIVFIRDRSKFRISGRDLWLIMLVGLINGVVFNFLYFYTIINSRASIAVVLLYTSPVFVIILARILFKEKITRYKFIALVLTVIGCVFVTGVLGEGYMPPPVAILTGVLTGFLIVAYHLEYAPLIAVIVYTILTPKVSYSGNYFLPDEPVLSDQAVVTAVENPNIADIRVLEPDQVYVDGKDYGTSDFTITDGDKAYHYSLEIYENDEGHSQLNITKK